MSTPCEKHALLPVVGQSPCAGCEIERLRAENEALHAQVDALAERHASALCEMEVLRKDVDRYRFIRTDVSSGKSDICIIQKDWIAGRDTYLSLEQADYVIDAAMSKAPLANPGQ